MNQTIEMEIDFLKRRSSRISVMDTIDAIYTGARTAVKSVS